MFRQITVRKSAIVFKNCNIFGISATRFVNNDNTDDITLPGLKKCGNFKEELYFKKKNEELIQKMRKEGETLKSYGYFDTNDLIDDAVTTGTEARQVRGSCLANKRKNSSEEAYFLQEQNQALKVLSKNFDKISKKTLASLGTAKTPAVASLTDASDLASTATALVGPTILSSVASSGTDIENSHDAATRGPDADSSASNAAAEEITDENEYENEDLYKD